MTTDYTKPLKPSQPDLTNTSDNGVDTSDDETTKRKPTISGTAEPGSTLRIFDGGVEVGTVKVALDGSWNYTFRTKLTQTTHTITVQAEDLAGNLSDASDPLILVVATPPAPPTGIELIAADDSGSSNTDNITNVQLPTFSGKAAPGLTVELYDENNDKIGTGIANASGDWTITSTKTLPDGNRTIKAIAIDLTKGYRSDDDEDVPQPTLGIVIDTLSQAPSQPDLSAADDSGLSNSDNITNVLLPEFSGTAEPGSSVELFSDQEGAIGTVTAGSDGKWTIRSTKPLRQGKHKITARVQDIAGNPVSAPSAPLDIEIDDENPLAAPTGLDMTAATDTGISNSDDITGDNTPDFTGNAEPNSRVTLTSDKDGVIGTATANGSGVWTLTASKNLQGGVHVITAVASDVAGNESPVSSPLNITIVPPPPAPPAPDMDAPTDSGLNTDNITNIDEPDFVGSGLPPGSTVTLNGDLDGLLGTAIVQSDGTWKIPSKKLRVGKQKVRATVTDPTGTATSAPSAPLDIEIDLVATKPVITKLSDATNSGSKSDSLTNLTTVELEGTAEANSTVVLKNGSGPTLGTGTADGSGNWKISIVPGVTGVIPVTVTATDVAGNTANSDPFNFEIDTTKPATPTAPDLTAGTDTGVNNDDITSNAQPTFTGTGAEVGGTVKLFSDGSLIGEVLSPDGTWTIPSTVALAVGDRNITVTVTDAAGNVSDPSPVLPVKIVGAPPAPSAPNLLAADDSGLPADNITNVLEPNVTGTSTAPDGSTITLYDGTDVIGTGAIAGGTWTVKLTPKRTGKQKIKAQVTNVAGGTSPFSAETEIDIDPSTDIPVITDLLAASDSGVKGDKITNALEPDLTGTAEPNSSIELFDENAVKIGTGTTDGTGKWTIKIRPNRKGKIKVKAVATDIAGNVSSPSADTEITIDDVALATIPDLTDATDTGINNDDITSNIKPDFTGIAEPGSTVKLFSDKDGLIGTVVANATTGVWTITSTQDLQPGAHAITTQIDTDIAGNQSPISSPLNIRILAAPGTVTVDLNTPSDSKGDSDTDNITNVKQPTFSGIADANSSIKLFAQIGTGARVQIGTGTANPNGDWTIAVSSDLADAIYSITADATELAAGTTKTSAPLNVTIDTLAPSAPLVPDLEDASDSGLNSDNITNVEEPFFVLTAEPNLTVTLFSDLEGTDPIGTGKADATGKVRIQAKKLRAGKHNIRAKATDIAGNISGFSPDLVVDVMTSGSAVTIDLLSEDTGASTSDRLTSDSTPQFDGTAGANADIELIFSGAATKTITGIKADAQGKWVYQILDADLLADGDYTLVAKATDPVSNVSNSSPFSFTIDSLVPGIPTVDLTDGSDDGLSNSDNETTIARPIFTGTADADVLVEVYAGTNLIGTTNADTTGKWTLPALTTPLALGNYNITAKAKRRSGKTSDSTALPIKIVAPLPNVTLAIDKTTLTESEGTATLTATLSVAYPQAVTVNLGFSGTATNGTDYRLSATAIVIEPGRTSGSVTLKTTRDAIADNNETILVDILSVINGVEATPQQVRATIQENSLPVAQSVAGSVNPILLGGTATIKGISATDADGTITSYQIVTLPAADQGVLFLGSPTAGGRPVTAGQRLTITDIGRLTFRASSSFKETRFTYAAIDNLGDLSNPATINLIVSGPDPDADENGPCGKGRTFNGKTKNDRFKGGKGADRVKGGKGNDRLSGGLCSDIMVGGSGNDRLMGDSGADKIQGGSGNDRIDGGTGLDTLNGGSGNDMLLGRAGHDRLRGGTGKDRLKGGTGNDRLNGNILNDLLKGEAGDDLLNGGVGSDRLIGGSGNDMMVGRTGNERMRGGLGDDVLYGGLGKDIMNGGPGRDRFVYRRLDEKGDRINGFVPADDVIDLRDIFRSRATGNPNAFSEFVKLAQRGTSTIVRVDSNGNAAGGLTTLAVMQGVNASSLTASNFLLS